MNCEDVITYILAGLGHEYDSFVALISARTDKVTIEEIYSLLLTTEARLSRHQLSSPTPPTSVNIAQRQYHPSQNRGKGGSRGRGRSNRAGSTTRHSDHNPVVCQVCNKPSHSTCKCYFRFDLSFQDPKPEQKQTLVAASTGTWDTEWHTDTGATHHVINDLNNLSLRNEDYQGSDQVQVGSDAAIRDQNAPALSQTDNLLSDLQHHCSQPGNVPASSNHHPRTTKSKNNIHKPRKHSNDSFQHPLP
ncbi:hypothetical protein F0562_006344 [Nyssa sinensis]|uniref:Uncharacterized protein n=1 Tax=Nyssa sinensis TaxID=561372 RepID=A0A5J5ANX6_9ASTE|nr:hypothetical protein F0562_006344 [Nyssa sinensis]